MGDMADMLFDSMLEQDFYWPAPRRSSRRRRDHKYRRVLTETTRAWLVLDMSGNHVWFPKSVCTLYEEHISAPQWLKPVRTKPKTPQNALTHVRRNKRNPHKQ